MVKQLYEIYSQNPSMWTLAIWLFTGLIVSTFLTPFYLEYLYDDEFAKLYEKDCKKTGKDFEKFLDVKKQIDALPSELISKLILVVLICAGPLPVVALIQFLLMKYRFKNL